MKVRQVTVGYSRTWNTRQFESAKIEVQYQAELEEGDDPLVASGTLFAHAKAEVKLQSAPILIERAKRDKAMMKSVFAGLPKDLQTVFVEFVQSHMSDVKAEDFTDGN